MKIQKESSGKDNSRSLSGAETNHAELFQVQSWSLRLALSDRRVSAWTKFVEYTPNPFYPSPNSWPSVKNHSYRVTGLFSNVIFEWIECNMLRCTKTAENLFVRLKHFDISNHQEKIYPVAER